MYANLGPGQLLELDPPSSSGVELVHSHRYVANRRRDKSREDRDAAHAACNLYTYCLDSPINHLDPSGLKVEVCWRRTDVHIFRQVGFLHYWLKIPGKATGRGTIDDKCCNSCICSETTQKDHTGQVGTCVEIGEDEKHGWSTGISGGYATYYACDQSCVDKLMVVGKSEGRFFWPWNDCHTTVVRILDQCCKSTVVWYATPM